MKPPPRQRAARSARRLAITHVEVVLMASLGVVSAVLMAYAVWGR